MTEYKIVRKAIRMGEELADWYEERAARLGMSQSNLMIMALAEYVKQDKAVNMFDEYSKLKQEDNKPKKE